MEKAVEDEDYVDLDTMLNSDDRWYPFLLLNIYTPKATAQHIKIIVSIQFFFWGGGGGSYMW